MCAKARPQRGSHVVPTNKQVTYATASPMLPCILFECLRPSIWQVLPREIGFQLSDWNSEVSVVALTSFSKTLCSGVALVLWLLCSAGNSNSIKSLASPDRHIYNWKRCEASCQMWEIAHVGITTVVPPQAPSLPWLSLQVEDWFLASWSLILLDAVGFSRCCGAALIVYIIFALPLLPPLV